jgi:DNA-binding CsgD family transcriptional regulator
MAVASGQLDTRLETVLDQLASVNTLDALQSHILGLRDTFQVEHLVYHSVNASGGQYAALSYDLDWVDRYVEQGYERVDPVVQGCYRRFHPIDWKALDWSAKPSRAFLHEALDHGVGNQGLSMPVRGPTGQFAVFTVNQTTDDLDWARYRAAHLDSLILTSHFLNLKALEITNGTDQTEYRALSPREVDALSLLAVGCARAEIADRLTISEHTLRVYIESARHKLGAANTTHAVARALSLGLIVV